METLEDHSWQRRLGKFRFLLVRTHIAQERRVAFQHTVHSSNEEVKFFIVEAIVPVELFLKMIHRVNINHQ